jgi:hypothetical protein
MFPNLNKNCHKKSIFIKKIGQNFAILAHSENAICPKLFFAFFLSCFRPNICENWVKNRVSNTSIRVLDTR